MASNNTPEGKNGISQKDLDSLMEAFKNNKEPNEIYDKKGDETKINSLKSVVEQCSQVILFLGDLINDCKKNLLNDAFKKINKKLEEIIQKWTESTEKLKTMSSLNEIKEDNTQERMEIWSDFTEFTDCIVNIFNSKNEETDKAKLLIEKMQKKQLEIIGEIQHIAHEIEKLELTIVIMKNGIKIKQI